MFIIHAHESKASKNEQYYVDFISVNTSFTLLFDYLFLLQH